MARGKPFRLQRGRDGRLLVGNNQLGEKNSFLADTKEQESAQSCLEGETARAIS